MIMKPFFTFYKKILLFSFVLFASIESYSSETPAILREWAAYSGISDSTYKTPVLTENDYSYVATVEENTVSGADIVVIKYNNNGIAIWKQPWTGAGLGRDQAADMVMDSLYLYICGTTFSSTTNFDYVVIKMQKANGAIEWTQTFNGTANNYDIATAIAINDSSIYVTGVTSSLITLLDYHTLKYHINGTLLWSVNFDYNNLMDIPFAISYSQEDSNIIVTGGSQSSIYDWDYQTNIYKYNGTTVDLGRVSGTSVGFDRATAVKTDSLGNIYITGATRENNSNFDIKTVKLDKLGNLIWQRTFDNNGGNDIANDLVVNNVGEIYLVGTIEGNGSDYLVMRLDASNGGIVWQNTIDCGANDTARAICFDSHGNIVITGQAFNPENANYDFLTVNFDRAGQELWRDYFDGPDHGDDNATNIASDNDGNIFVTGQTWVGNDFHTVTIKYKTDFFTQPPAVDSPSVAYLFYPNSGQLVNTGDSLVTDSVHYYTLHHSPQLYFGYGKMNMVWSHFDKDTATADTLQRVDVTFLNSTNLTEAYPVDLQDSIAYLNYYLGQCPNGITNVHGSGSLLFADAYYEIDAIYSSNNAGMKLTFVCNPGSVPQEIGLAFEGDNGVSIINNWGLKVSTSLGDYEFEKPHVYQLNSNGNRINLPWHLNWNIVQNGQANFTGWGNYDAGLPLIVELSNSISNNAPMPDNADWGTYLGGSGTDGILDNCVDGQHNYYVCGFTFNLSFPNINGTTIITTYGGINSDAFVSKFHPDQSPEWTTYYGGSTYSTSFFSPDENALGMTITKNNNPIFVGFTTSTNFPLPSTNPFANGYFQNFNAGEPDGFIVELNPNGTRYWATYYGGNTKENIHAVIQDGDFIYICGSVAEHTEDTQPPVDLFGFPIVHFNHRNDCYPTLNPLNPFDLGLPLCNSGSGYFDNIMPTSTVRKGFIAKFGLYDKQLKHSTLFGGANESWLQDLDYLPNVGILFVGRTRPTPSSLTCSAPTNSDFPLCDIGGYFQTTNSCTGNNECGILAQFDYSLNLTWSTFFGSCDKMNIGHLAVNRSIGSANYGDLYITGNIGSANNILPITPCAPTNNCAFPLCASGNEYFRDHFNHTTNTNNNVENEIFITRFDPSRNITWSTFFGGSGEDFIINTTLFTTDANADIALDQNENVYLFSSSGNITSSTQGDVDLENLSGYYFDNNNSSSLSIKHDALLAAFNKQNEILWATYIGGDGFEYGTSVCLDGADYLYVAGITEESQIGAGLGLLTGSDLTANPYIQGQPPTSDPFNGFIWRFDMRGNVIGINEAEKSNQIFIYPNPATDFISINLENFELNKNSIIEISNFLGQCVYRQPISSQRKFIEINITHFANSIYNVRVFDKTKSLNSKLVIQK